MGVLAPRSVHAVPSAWPTINTAESPLNISPGLLQQHFLLHRPKLSFFFCEGGGGPNLFSIRILRFLLVWAHTFKFNGHFIALAHTFRSDQYFWITISCSNLDWIKYSIPYLAFSGLDGISCQHSGIFHNVAHGLTLDLRVQVKCHPVADIRYKLVGCKMVLNLMHSH